MSLQFITGGSGAGKSEYLSRLVCEESVRRPHDNFIVVVPEQYTMETQKKLVHMHSRKGILNIDVVSFERLAYKVFEELGGGNRPVLDDTGKNLIVRRVLEKEKKKLDYFGSSIEKTGFVSELKSVISELQYGITPQQLGEIGENVKEKQQLSAKLKDIRLVYKEFMAFLSTNYITSEEILDVLCGLVEKSKLIAGSEIIFDGFTGFTPIQYKLMRLLLVYSKGIKISVTIDKKERPTGHEGWNNLFFMSKEMMNRLIAICEEEGISGIVTGFTASEILTAFAVLLKKFPEGKPFFVNAYPRVVTEEGSIPAQKLIKEWMEPCDSQWRGLGMIKSSGLRLRKEAQDFDARVKFSTPKMEGRTSPTCRCGDVLQGKCLRTDCKVFGKGCTPLHPIGACMVSNEGACSAYYQYNSRGE